MDARIDCSSAKKRSACSLLSIETPCGKNKEGVIGMEHPGYITSLCTAGRVPVKDPALSQEERLQLLFDVPACPTRDRCIEVTAQGFFALIRIVIVAEHVGNGKGFTCVPLY